MSDWQDNEIVEAYATAEQVQQLNETIIQLRKQIIFLQAEIEKYENLPMPRGVVDQIIQLEATNRKLEADLKFYKNHVNPQIVINRENKSKPTRRGGIPK